MSQSNRKTKPQKTIRNYSPQYDRTSSIRETNISQAQTSVDYDRERDDQSNQKSQRIEEESKISPRKNQKSSRQRHKDSRISPRKFDRRSRSFQNINHSSEKFQKSRDICEKQRLSRKNYYDKEQPRFSSKDYRNLSKSQIQSRSSQILNQIQRFDYQNLSFFQLKSRFIRCSGQHLKFPGIFPQALDQVGTLLLKDGLFHDMWSLAFLKNQQISKQTIIQSYYALFRPIIEKDLASFEKTFNPIPGDDYNLNSDMAFKKYRRSYEENTRSTTKMDVMILFEQVKADLKSAQMEENMVKKVQKSIEEFKLKSIQDYPHQSNDPYLSEWFENSETNEKNWTAQEEHYKRQQQIEKIKKSRIRERSPLSNRFRMMHQVQSNQRRMKVQMACVFLRLDVFYFFNDLHIVKVDQAIFSENQQIVVLKAFSVDFCPLMGKMKIQPKLKNLIAIYKFCNLVELIRLENTHGKFDGIIVYPQSFNVRKYLTSSQELSLLNDDCLKQIKEQINASIPQESRQY